MFGSEKTVYVPHFHGKEIKEIDSHELLGVLGGKGVRSEPLLATKPLVYVFPALKHKKRCSCEICICVNLQEPQFKTCS